MILSPPYRFSGEYMVGNEGFSMVPKKMLRRAAQYIRNDVRTRSRDKVTTATKQNPGLRVFVESVVIVGSILLAFGIEAWTLTVK